MAVLLYKYIFISEDVYGLVCIAEVSGDSNNTAISALRYEACELRPERKDDITFVDDGERKCEDFPPSC